MNNLLDKQYTNLLQDILENGVVKKKILLNSFEREEYLSIIKDYSEEERLEMNPNASDEDVHKMMDDLGVPKHKHTILFNNKIIIFYE